MESESNDSEYIICLEQEWTVLNPQYPIVYHKSTRNNAWAES